MTRATARAKRTLLTAREIRIEELRRQVVSLLASIAPLPDAEPAWTTALELARGLPDTPDHALLAAIDAVQVAVDALHKGSGYSRFGHRNLLSARSTMVRQKLVILRLRVVEEIGDE